MSYIPGDKLHALHIKFDLEVGGADFRWNLIGAKTDRALGRIRQKDPKRLLWEVTEKNGPELITTSMAFPEVEEMLNHWLRRYLTPFDSIFINCLRVAPETGLTYSEDDPPFTSPRQAGSRIFNHLIEMIQVMEFRQSPLAGVLGHMNAHPVSGPPKEPRKKPPSQTGIPCLPNGPTTVPARAKLAAKPEVRSGGDLPRTVENVSALPSQSLTPPSPRILRKEELPPVPVHFVQNFAEPTEASAPLPDWHNYRLRERAALWWISSQSDDLLCLPHCKIRHLDHQVRTALRVLGPLRGRALLSDEVGLGKTIEAGLVIKELLIRGMIKRFLVLTVPSLVDQWEEELVDKFNLQVGTTNQISVRDNPTFWNEHQGIVASLHTLKQSAQLAIATQIHWDLLIVDEAHHLRNRESQAWQAVNALPRQYLLLLTATPVQNSIEELYNLVTLLQPGQLPTPKEFRRRFIDPKRPRQPREPEQLRRLLGQVMIRNTRANAGIDLPPRQAESVVFGTGEREQHAWQDWEREFRGALQQLTPSQVSLWGRLVLQAAGSSPAAWCSILKKFPNPVARTWQQKAPLDECWQKKCELLSPLTKTPGGVVIFSQFLETQQALANFLRTTGVPTFVINGSTPPTDRHPLTEEFRKQGGALLLTHSGTEGRNLQFCHQLVNFDLPWNPMEIEQRIGRLHRLGQLQPVRIYNFVQSGTLQEHLLNILQEKLNLFELVVGEAGLVLGDRFTSDEFAEEILRRWRESEGHVDQAFVELGEELATARERYGDIKKLDETLFAKNYESV